MTATPRTLGVLIVLALVAFLLWASTGDDAPTSFVAPASAAAGTPAHPAAAAQATALPTGTAATPPTNERTDVTPASPPPTAVSLRGQVLDSRGLPLANVPVALAPFDVDTRRVRMTDGDATTTSDERGQFTVPAPARTSALATGTAWYTLRTTTWHPGDGAGELLLIAAPSVMLTGRVTGSDGEGLEAATVRAQLFLLTEFPRPLQQTVVPTEESATTDNHGDYRLAAVPLATGVDLVFARQGYTTRRIASEQAASGRLDVTLTTLTGATGRIHGLVRDADGPVAGASLLLGFDQEATSDARGVFALEFPRRPSRLLATRRGWQPVIVEGVGSDTPEIEVVFAARALGIAGEVRFADGRPAVGWHLDLLDPVRGSGFRGVEVTCSDVDPTLATTDQEGRFRLGGLADRSYRLLAYEPAMHGAIESGVIAAGTTNVVLTVPADALVDDLRGAIVDRRGAAVPGAVVHAYLTPTSTDRIVDGPRATTGSDGSFALKRVPRRVGKLGFSKDGYQYVVQPLEACTRDGADLHVVLQRMCALQVEGQAGLVVTFLDGEGLTLHAESHSQGAVFSSNALTLHGGKSSVMTLPETTATMAWARDGKELGRKQVFLDPAPGAVTLLIAAL